MSRSGIGRTFLTKRLTIGRNCMAFTKLPANATRCANQLSSTYFADALSCYAYNSAQSLRGTATVFAGLWNSIVRRAPRADGLVSDYQRCLIDRPLAPQTDPVLVEARPTNWFLFFSKYSGEAIFAATARLLEIQTCVAGLADGLSQVNLFRFPHCSRAKAALKIRNLRCFGG